MYCFDKKMRQNKLKESAIEKPADLFKNRFGSTPKLPSPQEVNTEGEFKPEPVSRIRKTEMLRCGRQAFADGLSDYLEKNKPAPAPEHKPEQNADPAPAEN